MTTPLISDATLAKIVRLAYLAPDLGSIIREDMLSCVVDGELATAIEMARGECHPVNYGGQLIAALEEANEEAARTNDEREPRVEGECQELNLVRGEWIAPGAVPGLARAMADTIRATVAAHETQLDAVTADVRMAWTIAGHTYSTAAGHDAFTELRRKVEAGEWDEPLPDTTRIDATAKHPIPHLDDAPEPPKRQEHDPSRRWACPKCTSVLAVERIFEIVAGRGERYAHVVRCLCGEVRP